MKFSASLVLCLSHLTQQVCSSARVAKVEVHPQSRKGRDRLAEGRDRLLGAADPLAQEGDDQTADAAGLAPGPDHSPGQGTDAAGTK